MRDLPDPPRIDALIRWAARELSASPTPVIDARALAKFAFGLDDAALIAEGRRPVDAEALERFFSMVGRRAQDEPIAHIVRRREFWSLDLELAPGILVPRPDTEALVECVVRRRKRDEALKIVDLGCGSGALVCALMSEYPNASGLGVDISPDAVELTSRNLARLGFSSRARAEQGDWLDAIDGEFDVIVSNPPYIRTVDRGSLPREVREFESPLALYAGETGLDAYRAILKEAPAHLAADGLMALEFGLGQAEAVNELARTAFSKARIDLENDLAGRLRALVVDLRPPER